MSAKTMVFYDCSKLIWQDRETLRYEEKNFVALVWMDYESEIFSRGRVLKQCSLKYWHKCQAETDELITVEKKAEILAKVRQYFGNIPVRVEPR